jgi:hypothetical protein
MTSGSCTASVEALRNCLVSVILNPILALLFAVGLLVFTWGIVEFMVGLSADTASKKEDGKRHMLWGIVGMFIMSIAWALVQIIGNTIGVQVR